MDQQKRCFVIMPFGKRGTDDYKHNFKIYQIMIKPVLENCGYETIRADELEHMGNITRDIIELIHESDLVIADLSGKNANVFYELGVRHAIFKSGTIPIIKEGEKLPFDIANYRAVFYSSELDGPEHFKQELEKRINAFEKRGREKSDNPVHDILDNKLLLPNMNEYVDIKTFEERLEEITLLEKDKDELREELKEKDSKIEAIFIERTKAIKQTEALSKRIVALEKELKQVQNSAAQEVEVSEESSQIVAKFRNEPLDLSDDDVKAMLKKYSFFDSRSNEKGKGFNHNFEAQTHNGDKVVNDKVSDLVWQQGGSSTRNTFSEAKKWIQDLNQKGYADYNDWRLPTLEETMSLMEPEKKNNDLYIDPLFDKEQRWIWTCDKVKGESWAWVVYFYDGSCSGSIFGSCSRVRAVRSGESSSG